MDQFLVMSDLGGFTNLDAIKISGAVISTYMEMYPDRSGTLSQDFRMHVTDAFPLHSGMPYFPIPVFPDLPFRHGSGVADRIKAMKSRKRRPQYVSLDTARTMARMYAESGYTSAFMGDVLGAGGTMDQTLNVEELPGVAINPVTQESKIYTKEIARYGTDAKLWIHVGSQENDLLVALAALQDTGISSRRSTGLGKFKVRGARFSFSMEFTEPGLYLVLSPFIPDHSDMDSIDFEKSSYTLSIFSGNDRDGRPLGVYKYFETGSVLYLKKKLKGRWIVPGRERKRLLNFTGSFLRIGS